jgi:peroxiredoxin
MRKNKIVQWSILIVIACIGGYAIFSGLFKSNDNKIALGQAAPSFYLASLEGNTYKLSQFKGKWVVLNFWGSFCEPCVRETPLLSKMATVYKKEKVQFIGINLDEPKVVVQSFIRNTPVVYPILLDPDGVVRDRYQVTSYPTTFFIDKKGTIKSMYVGELNEQQLKSELDKLMK